MAYSGPTLISSPVFNVGVDAIAMSMPANLQGGERLLAFIETANQAVTTPAGWAAVGTAIGTGTAGGTAATRLSIFTREAVAGDSNTQLQTADPGDHWGGRVVAFTACDIHVMATSTGSSSTSGTAPSVTTTVPNCLVLQAVACSPDDGFAYPVFASNANLANQSQPYGDGTTQGNGGTFGLFIGQKEVAGASGTTAYTIQTAGVKAHHTLALMPKSSAPAARPTFQSFVIG